MNMPNLNSQNSSSINLSSKGLIFISLVILYVTIALIFKNLSPAYPATAIAISGFFIFGIQYFSAVFIGSLISLYIQYFTFHTPSIALLGISLGNTVEAIAAYYLIKFFLNKPALKNYAEFIALIFGLSLASIIGSLVNVTTLHSLNFITTEQLHFKFFLFWVGRFVGSLLLLPFLLEIEDIIIRKKNFKNYLFDINQLIIFFFLNITGLFLLIFVFQNDYNQSFVWFLCIALLFAGLYLNKLLSKATLVILGTGMLILTSHSFGQFDYGIKDFNIIYISILLFCYSISTLLVKPMKTELKYNKIFIISMMLSWFVICSVIYFTSTREHQSINNDLNTFIEKTIDGIEENAADAEDLLIGASGLIKAAPAIKSDDWKRYVDSHGKSKTFSVINGLGVIHSTKNLQSLPITFYASKYPTQIMPGIDLSGDPTLLKAADDAKKFKSIIASETTQLMHNGKLYNSFILFYPIMEKDFLGWIFAPVVTENFFNKALELYSENLYISVHEGSSLIFSTDDKKDFLNRNNNFLIKKPVGLYGVKWNTEFYPKADFFRHHTSTIVPISGLLITIYFLIACFLVELFTFGLRAEKLVIERTKEMEEARSNFLQASKMASLGEMAAGMAHEINNPLTIISGRLQILSATNKDPKVQTEIEKMLANTEKISQIITGLRKFSGKSDKAIFEIVSINKVINHSLSLCNANIMQNNVEIKTDFNEDFQINCIPTQISQVLFHLINNSCDAICNFDSRWIKIQTIKTANNTIQISVTDSGLGIPAKIADKLMQPFFTTKDVGVGKGIDLSISLGIMREHGGSLTLDRKAANTTFIIELPA